MSTGKKKARIGADEMEVKGELFSTDMVKAFLENRKSRTSRPIKPKYDNTHFEHRTDKYGTEFVEMQNDVEGETWGKNSDGSTWHKLRGFIVPKPKYQPGDIMYVRETWRIHNLNEPAFCMMIDYKADNHTELQIEFKPSRFDKFKKYFKKPGWISSIFMPCEAARLFFRVTDVKVQNIADMTEQDAEQDGFEPKDFFVAKGKICGTQCTALESFKQFWAKQYGADANWM
jgi:hypothetical protein